MVHRCWPENSNQTLKRDFAMKNDFAESIISRSDFYWLDAKGFKLNR